MILTRKASRSLAFHYWATLVLAIAVLPILHTVGLPLKFTWTDYFTSYWLALVVQSLFTACVLYVAGCPFAETLAPILHRIQKQKMRLLFLIPLAVFLAWLDGPAFGFVLFIDAIAILECVDRSTERRSPISEMCFDVFVPAAYLFVAFVLIFAYNDIIALLRYDGSWEYILNRADAFILGGHTVSPLAHAVLSRWPQSIPWLQTIYFAMFAQVGAAIAILAWRDGRSMALKFVGTVVSAYYIGLFIFYLMPTTGPYAICGTHFSVLPSGITVYEVQRIFLDSLSRLRTLQTKDFIGRDYFIGMPSMHVVQPLIVLWFLRRWKRMVIVLVAFDIVLLPAILLLEQHYLVDLISALPVAFAAIAITRRDVPREILRKFLPTA